MEEAGVRVESTRLQHEELKATPLIGSGSMWCISPHSDMLKPTTANSAFTSYYCMK